MKPKQDIQERFMSKVMPEPMSGCWLWTGAVNNIGYGMFHVEHNKQTNKSKAALAHRVSFELYTGNKLGKLNALHRCDNPSCVNPDHLFAGTPADNVADMDNKGRRVSKPLLGSRHGRSKINEDDVKRIRVLRQSGMKQKEIAAIFGISQVQVSNILLGTQWNHNQEKPQ